MLASLAVTVALAGSGHAAPPTPAIGRCGHEDEPTWVWSRCGNKRRGAVSTLDGARNLILTPCAFARLYRYIDWSRTPRMRGDYTARTGPCRKYPVAPESIY